MATDHPFQHLFENFGRLPEAHSESVNQIPRERLKSLLDVPVRNPGHCFLLKAPRAGHGKTHLLSRLMHELVGSHEFIPLQAVNGSRIDAATVLDDTLRRLVRGLPAGGGLTVLDLIARRLFSIALQPLVNSGEVSCKDREAALIALRDLPIETFDFHHPGAVTAHWAKNNFELLGPRLALEIAQRNGLSLREVSFWVDALFRFASTPIDNPSRVRTLASLVFNSPFAEAVANERLVALLGMLTTLQRVVLVADELEGFSLDESAALRFASFVCSLRQAVERVDVIISVNQDIWDNAFLPRLSAGLADRISELTVEIEPLDLKGAIAVIESRLPGQGEKIAAKIRATHARGIVSEAAELWTRKELDEQIKPALTEPEMPIMVVPSAAAVIAVEPTPEIEVVASELPLQPTVASIEVAPPESTSNVDASKTPAPQVESSFVNPNTEGVVSDVQSHTPVASNPMSLEEDSTSEAQTTENKLEPQIPEEKVFKSPAPQVESPFVDSNTEGVVSDVPSITPVASNPKRLEENSPSEINSSDNGLGQEIPAEKIFAQEPAAPSATAELFTSPVQAPVSYATEPLVPAIEIPHPPVPEPEKSPAKAPPRPASEASSNHVDDLLRQFRERYGKS